MGLVYKAEDMKTHSRIQGIRRKIERAKEHIGDLDVAISDFRSSEPYALSIKEYPEISHVGSTFRAWTQSRLFPFDNGGCCPQSQERSGSSRLATR